MRVLCTGFFPRSRRIQHAVVEDIETGNLQNGTGDRGASRRSDRLSSLRSTSRSTGSRATGSRGTVTSRSSLSVFLDSDDETSDADRAKLVDFFSGFDFPHLIVIRIDLDELPKIDSYKEEFILPRSFSIKAKTMDVKSGKYLERQVLEFPTRVVHENLELNAFPLDVQRLHVRTRLTIDDFSTLEHIIARSWCAENSSDKEWKLERNTFDVYYYWTCTGSIELEVVITMRRLPLFYFYNIVVPVTCIVLFAFLSFWFSPSQLSERLQVTLTMVLTLVAFKLSVSSANYIPRVGFLTLMDKYMFGGFILVALVALQNYVSAVVHDTLPWWDEASAWALIASWGAFNLFVLLYGICVWRQGDSVERQKDSGFEAISHDHVHKMRNSTKLGEKESDLLLNCPGLLFYPKPWSNVPEDILNQIRSHMKECPGIYNQSVDSDESS
eukprot:363028-Chlamydomonas_euryale.AAC.5